jgi:hypothetical protein
MRRLPIDYQENKQTADSDFMQDKMNWAWYLWQGGVALGSAVCAAGQCKTISKIIVYKKPPLHPHLKASIYREKNCA